MREEKAFADVRALEDIISRLSTVRDQVGGFNASTYEDAGGALWAGRERNRFTNRLDEVRQSHSQISGQIELAISDCRNRQRTLAYSINPIEHPIIFAQAAAIAL